MGSNETTGYDPIGVLCLAAGLTLVVLSTLSHRLAYGGGLEGTPVGNILTYMGPLLEPMFLVAFLLGAVTALMGLAVLLRQGVSIVVGV
ncbi:hypothetical protein CP556_24880 [Natrinema sp. CBA1119]|uniref:hypothetical protein n=1 Tax=Natrinema sp. CBA1119 TaxID=1608465 RepID=UPI000BF70975|nr:hypothetical protein [Natrinema sp. CBA1119]PGF14243.1 hypothetical protein CP556_24880 [Natrinema sp. CBA1119]